MYNIVDSNNSQTVAKADTKFDAQMKVFELNNKENGYKYVAEISAEDVRKAFPKVFEAEAGCE